MDIIQFLLCPRSHTEAIDRRNCKKLRPVRLNCDEIANDLNMPRFSAECILGKKMVGRKINTRITSQKSLTAKAITPFNPNFS